MVHRCEFGPKAKLKQPNLDPGSHNPRQIFSSYKCSDSQSTCNFDRISRVAERSVKAFPFYFPNNCKSVVVANLILKEGIPDIFRDSRRSLNIVFAFLVALSTDAIVEHVPIVPDWSQIARAN